MSALCLAFLNRSHWRPIDFTKSHCWWYVESFFCLIEISTIWAVRSKQSEGVEGLKIWLGLAVSHVSEVYVTTQWGYFRYIILVFLNESYKVKPIGQWRKILVTQMGYACIFGHRLFDGTGYDSNLAKIWLEGRRGNCPSDPATPLSVGPEQASRGWIVEPHSLSLCLFNGTKEDLSRRLEMKGKQKGFFLV